MANNLHYKGFTGIYEYSIDDELFCGIIDGTNGLHTFDAATKHVLKQEFRNAVDNYLILEESILRK